VRRKRLCVFAAGLVSLVTVVALSRAVPANATPTDLFISEYVEGTSNNKAIEIFNGTGSPVDLSAGQYVIQMYFNGSTASGLDTGLLGTLASGDVHVVANPLADAAILAVPSST
jgi:predicted extracellular nuclease